MMTTRSLLTSERRRRVALVPATSLRPLKRLVMTSAAAPDLTLDDLLSDPLVQMVMRRDGVGPEDARAAFRAGAEAAVSRC